MTSDATVEIRHPYDGQTVALVAKANGADADRALEAAVMGAHDMAHLPAHKRAAILDQAADLLDAAASEIAELITLEQGKTIAEAAREAARAGPLLRLCAAEARRLGGEVLPLDGYDGGEGKLGLAVRVPSGVVLAITPFNYPCLLVLHKVGPALAAGNAVIIKPASATPLTALRIAQALVDAGLPGAALQCLVGSGSELGHHLCIDERVRVISFTGSRDTGRAIAAAGAGRRMSLELGANCPTIVLGDADLEKAASSIVVGAFANAGQVCISAQRVLATQEVADDLVELLASRTARMRAGDPRSPDSDIGPMIDANEAARVQGVVAEAVASGARVVAGGQRSGAVHQPTVVADVPIGTRLFREELFGPAVAITKARSAVNALALANDSEYGLAAAVFTRDIDQALRFVRDAQFGVVHVNSSPLWRADAMPYGGVKDSGFGREGPRYAIESMTEIKTVIVHQSATED